MLFEINKRMIEFNTDTISTFCGGRTLTNVRPKLNTYPISKYQSKWKELSEARKKQLWDNTKALVYKDLAAFTDKLEDCTSEGRYLWIGDKDDSEWLFDTDELEDREKVGEDEYIVPRSAYDIGLRRGILFISDAINGETDSPYHITTYDLAMASPKWKAILKKDIINPNSYRKVNSWALTVNNERHFSKLHKDLKAAAMKREQNKATHEEMFMKRGPF